MTRRLTTLLIAFILLVPATQVSATPQYRYTMTWIIENRGSIAAHLDDDDIAVPLFTETQWKRVRVSSATPPLGSSYTDDDGNNLANAGVALDMPAGTKLTYTVIYEIESNDEARPQLDASKAGKLVDLPQGLSEYTAHSPTFMSGNEAISALAASLTEGEPTILGKLLRLVRWFRTNITYDNAEIPRFADETLRSMKGDCDDQSILLISMLRSLGIPSYLEVGIVLSTSINARQTSWEGHLEITERGIGWHGWAMVYVPPWGWIPVDLTLVRYDDPMEMLRNAPECSSTVITAFKISKQDYTTSSKETRERIINSSIYVTSIEVSERLQETSWVNPTMIILGITVAGGIIFMFYTARRPIQKEGIRYKPPSIKRE